MDTQLFGETKGLSFISTFSGLAFSKASFDVSGSHM